LADPVVQIDGAFEVLPDLGCLRRINGPEIALRPKTFQTLIYLLRNRQRLVTKDELTAHLWPDTAVTDDAVVQCVVELRKALGDAAREPRFIRTVPKLGYRFVGPVAEPPPPSIAVASVAATPPLVSESNRPVSRGWHVAAPLTFAAMLVAAAMFVRGSIGTETAALDPTSGKPGIAVMFLDNQSRTPDIDWMRQGLADMLITGLSRSPRVSVLGRKHLETLLTAVNHPADQQIPLSVAKQVARRARASHVLTGSFTQVGEKTRVDVRIETLDSRTVAIESLTVDRPDDVLGQVDLLAWKLARHFDEGVARPAAVPEGLTVNLNAFRAYSLGLSKAAGYHNADAVKLFERALELDPNFIMARARLGYAYAVTWARPEQGLPYLEQVLANASQLREVDRLAVEAWHGIATHDFAAAATRLQRLVSLAPYEIESYVRLARLLVGERRYDEAIEVVQRGLAVDSQSTDLYNVLGAAYLESGRDADAIAALQRYVDLAPYEANSLDSLGIAYQDMGRYAEAEAAFDHALALKPDFEMSIAHLANVHFQTGRYASAERLYRRYLEVVSADNELARGWACISVIRARSGRWHEAVAAAKLSGDHARKVRGPSDPPLALMALPAHAGRPIDVVPGVEVKPFPDRGNRASKRWFLWFSGRRALAEGDTAHGLDLLRQSLLERPISYDIDPLEDALALAHLELGRYDDAIAEFTRLLRANPRYPRAHFHLAAAYEAKGDAASAANALGEFLSVWSRADADVPEVVDATARLARLTR